MSSGEQSPTKRPTDIGEKVEHPAFGKITMTTSTGSRTLFGSDLRHNQVIHICVHRAHMVCGPSDWVHDNELLVEFDMSHAQFAQFITSNGNGSGTPVTLRYAAEPGGKLQDIPRIKNIEQKTETMRNDIRDATRKQIENIRLGVAELRAMATSGKIGVKELREKMHSLSCHIDNLPANLAYQVECAEEAMEKVVSDAKIEIEAHIDLAARRIGLDNIGQLGLAMNNTKGIEDASHQG